MKSAFKKSVPTSALTLNVHLALILLSNDLKPRPSILWSDILAKLLSLTIAKGHVDK